ncbi:MAG: aspartate aminotransferase family protein [Rhizobacter sp.]|nr:aspartate aminotransferase family protein [Chlorobiales bacterium]
MSTPVLESVAIEPFLEKEHELFFHTYSRLPVELERGEGVYLYDKQGKRYLDMIAGIGVNALGYGNKRVEAAITEQVRKYIHTSNLFVPEMQIKLAERLLSLTGLSKVFFANSGAEAIEGAMKLSRKWGSKIAADKTEILSLTNGFHGRTYGALSLTAKPKYHEGYYPLLPDTGYITFNDVEDLERKVSGKTCAVVLEFVQGEGGICPVSQVFATRLKALSEEYNFLIVADEVQAGCGRTGRFFSYMHFVSTGIAPDLVCAAKPLGGGLPLAAIIGGDRVAEVFTKGVHGTTFGGNPVACAAGLALIDELLEKDLMTHAEKVGGALRAAFETLKQKHIQIRSVRQHGLMLGISVSRDAGYYAERALQHGVIINATSVNVIRLLPPLIITESEAMESVRVLDLIFSNEWRE